MHHLLQNISLPGSSVHITLSVAKNRNRIANIRILGDKKIKWRRVAVGPDVSKHELIKKAVNKGRKYCPSGPIMRQKLFDELF